jgi:hypothetical protein
MPKRVSYCRIPSKIFESSTVLKDVLAVFEILDDEKWDISVRCRQKYNRCNRYNIYLPKASKKKKDDDYEQK